MRKLMLTLLTSLTLAACGPFTGDPSGDGPQPEDYDQSCQQDSDCAVVWLARACSCGEAAAVNISEQAAIEADNDHETRFEGRCRSIASCAYVAYEASCQANQCTLTDVTGEMQ